ncbi:DNA translocase FtsK [Cupriavidus sp. Marseille-Q8015]
MQADVLFQKALELVHQHRAASAALLHRHLGIDHASAERLLERMASETTAVRRMPNGLYLYIHGSIGEELAALHGFAQVVLKALAQDSIDAGQLRAAAVRFGLANSPTEASTRRRDLTLPPSR